MMTYIYNFYYYNHLCIFILTCQKAHFISLLLFSLVNIYSQKSPRARKIFLKPNNLWAKLFQTFKPKKLKNLK